MCAVVQAQPVAFDLGLEHMEARVAEHDREHRLGAAPGGDLEDLARAPLAVDREGDADARAHVRTEVADGDTDLDRRVGAEQVSERLDALHGEVGRRRRAGPEVLDDDLDAELLEAVELGEQRVRARLAVLGVAAGRVRGRLVVRRGVGDLGLRRSQTIGVEARPLEVGEQPHLDRALPEPAASSSAKSATSASAAARSRRSWSGSFVAARIDSASSGERPDSRRGCAPASTSRTRSPRAASSSETSARARSTMPSKVLWTFSR